MECPAASYGYQSEVILTRFTDPSTPRPRDPSSRISAAGCRRAFRIQNVTYNLNIYETKAIAILKVKICA